MVNVLELKAQIARKGMTYKEVYEKMGISRKSWYDRIYKKQFNSDEMYALIKILDIKNPEPIFFADEVTQ